MCVLPRALPQRRSAFAGREILSWRATDETCFSGEQKQALVKRIQFIIAGRVLNFDKNVIEDVFVPHYQYFFGWNGPRFSLTTLHNMLSNVPILPELNRIGIESPIQLFENEDAIDALPFGKNPGPNASAPNFSNLFRT